ncbi:MAG: hypothetical protein ABEJ30_00370, partial [Halorientalis sp.]
ALTPFYFLNLPGLNLGPADVLFVAVAASLVLSGTSLVLFPSRRIGIGALVFLLGAGISLLVTPRPVEGALDFLQYVLIFAVVVPVTITVFRDRRRYWLAVLLIWVGLNVVVLAATVRAVAIVTSPTPTINALKHMSLWYGNQNLLYWIVASAAITDLVVALDRGVPRPLRRASGGLAVPAFALVFAGQSVTAVLMASTAGWLAVLLWLSRREANRGLGGFLGATAVAVAGVVAIVVTHLEFFLWLGNVEDRLFMYTTALRLGTQALPFGTGLESSSVVVAPHSLHRTGVTSIHNFALAYYLETGILGVAGFLAVVMYWLRDVALAHVARLRDLALSETVPMLVFGGYLVVILFQNVPVQRFWWVLFGLSCAAVARPGQSPASDS